jgi:para-nitrobenzyl esterase
MWWLWLACGDEEAPDSPEPTTPSDTAEPLESPSSTADSGAPDTGTPPPPPPICPPGTPGPRVETTTGCVTGIVQASGREAFLGIPFAEPPIGARRFAPPAPVAPWSTPLAATAPGPVCVQFSDSLTGDLHPGDGDEDCLRLNVFRPAGAADLPLLVFVHGGGHLSGSGSEAVYADDPALATDAVVVTVNYRLGPLGFLAHPALSAEDPDGVSGNFGLRDVHTALRWVNDNAAALGGDPDRVLLFGESAGALETCAALLSPRAGGLFDAAIAQSGPCQSVGHPLRGTSLVEVVGEPQGEAFAAALGCADAACLRALPLADLVAEGQTDVAVGPSAEGWVWSPWLDGVWLPEDPVAALRAGTWNRVPFLATVNADEGTLFTAGFAPTPAALDAWLDLYALLLGVRRADLAATYDPAAFGGTERAFAALWGDVAFVCPTVWQQEALAAQGPAFGGFWTEEFPLLGAFHGSELPYVFGTGRLLGRGDAASARLRSAWTDMADGAPALPDLAGAWPPADQGWVDLSFDPSAVVGPPHADRCALFEGSAADLWH